MKTILKGPQTLEECEVVQKTLKKNKNKIKLKKIPWDESYNTNSKKSCENARLHFRTNELPNCIILLQGFATKQ